MDTKPYIPTSELDRVQQLYALCLQKPTLCDKFTYWDLEKANKLLEARKRLFQEFSDIRETSFEDIVAVNLAEAYVAYNSKDIAAVIEKLREIIALYFSAIQSLKDEQVVNEALEKVNEGLETNKSNESNDVN